MRHTFRSLKNRNYRAYAMGALVSNVGTWMQRTAQDWIVLTELTKNNATALGIVMALQFGPQVALLPLTGYAADHFDRRKLLIFTQCAMGLLALGLGLLILFGIIKLWHVYLFALLLGCVSAFDGPVRQTFVSDLVGEEDLANAVALNSTSFNAARMIGPALAGVLIGLIGSGWVFVANAASYVAVLAALGALKIDPHAQLHPQRKRGSLLDGFRYIGARPDIRAALAMFFLIGTFGINYPIFISTMSVTVFHAGAKEFGLLTSMMALGSVSGALLSAGRRHSGVGALLLPATVFGAGFLCAALAPGYGWFALTLVIVGVAAQTFTTTANSTVQLATEPAMRGRVMAILFAIALGGTPIGAPMVGWVADRFGPRWAIVVGASSGFGAALIALDHLKKRRANTTALT
jgi:MFS family permease